MNYKSNLFMYVISGEASTQCDSTRETLVDHLCTTNVIGEQIKYFGLHILDKMTSDENH